jgi:hypothetical protein
VSAALNQRKVLAANDSHQSQAHGTCDSVDPQGPWCLTLTFSSSMQFQKVDAVESGKDVPS